MSLRGQNFHTRESLQGPLWDKTVTHWGPSNLLDIRYSDIKNTYLNKHKSKYCHMDLFEGPLWDKTVTHGDPSYLLDVRYAWIGRDFTSLGYSSSQPQERHRLPRCSARETSA